MGNNLLSPNGSFVQTCDKTQLSFSEWQQLGQDRMSTLGDVASIAQVCRFYFFILRRGN